MEKKGAIPIWIFVLVLLIAIMFAYFMLKSEIKDSKENILEDSEEECLRVNGKWIEFNNGCIDSCEYIRNPEEISCIQVLTYGCECGKDKCWNGETCEDN